MNFVEFFYWIYYEKRVRQKSLDAGYHIVFIYALAQPFFDSLVRVLFSLPQQHEVFKGSEFYGRVDTCFYIAYGLSVVAVYFLVQRRVEVIKRKFDQKHFDKLSKVALVFLLVLFAMIYLLYWVEGTQYFATIPLYLLLWFVTSWTLHCYLKRLDS